MYGSLYQDLKISKYSVLYNESNPNKNNTIA